MPVPFAAGEAIESLYERLSNEIPEEPVDYTRNRNGTINKERERYQMKIDLLTQIDRSLHNGNLNGSLNGHDDIDTLVHLLGQMNRDVFAGNLTLFLRNMVEQNHAYNMGQRDERPNSWHAPREMVELWKATSAAA